MLLAKKTGLYDPPVINYGVMLERVAFDRYDRTKACQAAIRLESTMNLKISGHHLEVTPALREYVITKLDKVLRHFDQVIDGNVVLSVDNHKEKEKRQKVEINLHLKGKDIFVESADGDLYAAIDLMVDKLDRQVIRHKDRIQGHQHLAIKHHPEASHIELPSQ
jgi:putative sigma-54 modulation protein